MIRLFTLTMLACLFSITSFAISPINGTTHVCVGSTTTLSDTTSGGSWLSSDTAIATVGFSSGVVTGISAGTCIITYAGAAGSGSTTIVFTVNPLPGPISGGSGVTVGFTLPLSDPSTGGTWSSSNTGIATVSATTGLVTGVSTGIVTIYYTLPTGCQTSHTVQVSAAIVVSPINGIASVCVGSTRTLSDTTSGGNWSSSNTGIATVGSSTGVVTGVTAGTCIISYSLGTSSATIVFTVNPTPAPLSGIFTVAAGSNITLSDVSTGGTWSSANTSVATVGSISGTVTGVTPGTVAIFYTLPAGCLAYHIVTVTAATAIGPINGTASVCVGSSTSLIDTTAGGHWSSSSTAIATVGSSTGIVTGVSAGVCVISYTVGASSVTITFTVNPIPAAISGSTMVCVGLTTSLSDATSGGAWNSGSPGIASVSSGGLVTGITAGAATIIYSLAGCSTTIVVTVNPNPGMSGYMGVCVGGTTSLSSAIGGGTWSSGTPLIATVSSGGLVTGVSAGAAFITYMLPTGCMTTTVVTVNASSGIIPTSPVSICLGGTAALTDATTGGSWSSTNTGVATVSATGVVTGVAVGTSTISYTLTTGCSAAKVVTVNNAPVAITPHNPSICVGSTVLLSDLTSGGTWLSTITGVATVSSGGLVTSLATGVTEIEYSVGTCIARDTVYVIAGPATITPGAVTICLGGSATVSDATSGGSWSSSATGIVSVTSGGVLTANGVGTATISYTVGSCSATTIVTVNSAPGPINPTNPSVCVGSTVTLSDATSGGAWSSSNAGVATVAGGVVTGIAAGAATISYAIGSCSSTRIVTVNPAPATISGGSTVGAGSTLSLSDATAGGSWSSSNTSIATVSGTGLVTGVTPGTATIYYTTAAGCQTSHIVTVTALTGINGTAHVCAGSTVTLIDSTSGGHWTSSNTSIATIGSSTGIVTGVSAGTCIISYTVGTSTATVIFTVNAAPATISGGSTVTAGSAITLSDDLTGGTWTSSNTSIATVGATTGLVTGVAPGTATITYTTAGGCQTTHVVTVTSISGISGTASVCAGSTRALIDSTTGGTWSSSNTAIATVGSSTGIVTGISAGTCIITYTVGTGITTIIFTVNAAPATISGSSTVIAGTNITLSDALSGGTWSSSNISVATVGSSTGIVTGVAPGTVSINYTTAAGCQASHIVTVTPLTGIGGTASVCAGSTRTLTDATSGGQWSSSNTAVATVGSTTGVVTGVAAGTCVISYTLGTSSVTVIFTVNAAPVTISGGSTVIVGFSLTLSDAVAGGTWSSSNTAIATVGTSSGMVTAVSPGTVTINYTIADGCQSTHIVTVTALPGIKGTANVCLGSTVTLTDSISGGHWSSSNTSIATVGSSTGVVTGVASGTCTLTYTVGTNITTITFTVNFAPPISGSTLVSVGSTITLSDASPGGTWLSGYTPAATVGSATGVVTGVSPGTATIYYVTTAGCYASLVVTVSTPVHGISGTASVCQGSTRALSDSTSGGHWSSSNTAIATVGSSTGIVTGVSGGVCTITYTVGSSYVTIAFTVNAALSISGSTTVGAGGTITLSDAVSGGHWSSSNTVVATVGSSTGIVTGVSAGTAIIDYITPAGCTSSLIVTVSAAIHTIYGTASVCESSTRTLSDSTSGGHWSSSNTAIATVGSSTGVVTGVSGGTCTITYTVGSSFTTISFTVNTAPPITGSTSVGIGSHITLSDASPGGTWLSGLTPVATVGSSTGVVTGVSVGTATIYYVTLAGCSTHVIVTVHTGAAPHAGAVTTTVGAAVNVADEEVGGEWTSSDNGIATVDATGTITALAAGNASITHTATNSDGATTETVTQVSVSQVLMEIRLLPNPNRGSFMVKGIAGTDKDDVEIEITNMMGQVVYTAKATATGGVINEQVLLNNDLANGMYLLDVRNGSEHKTFHFVMEK